ncbi:zinc-finger domain-containing protein [Rhodobacteraceae bacterium CCMM004]|nr:zinc-finger domain-containing protein [Rhodobacteraceae bacterium CCMM004]
MSEKPVDPEGAPAPSAVPGAPETEEVTATRVACDGGEGALGHPRVWLQIAETVGWVECGYCDKRYVLKGSPAAAHGQHFDKSVSTPDGG